MSYQPIFTEEQLLSIADIARHFSLPESTARYYCKRFAVYMPSVGEGRRKRYRKAALEVIGSVLECMRDTRTASGVEAHLAERFPRNALAVLPGIEELAVRQDAAMPRLADGAALVPLALLEQQSRALDGIAAALALLVRRQDELEMLANEARTARSENQTLRSELARVQSLQFSSEKLHQDDMDQVRSWLGRLARHVSRASC